MERAANSASAGMDKENGQGNGGKKEYKEIPVL